MGIDILILLLNLTTIIPIILLISICVNANSFTKYLPNSFHKIFKKKSIKSNENNNNTEISNTKANEKNAIAIQMSQVQTTNQNTNKKLVKSESQPIIIAKKGPNIAITSETSESDATSLSISPFSNSTSESESELEYKVKKSLFVPNQVNKGTRKVSEANIKDSNSAAFRNEAFNQAQSTTLLSNYVIEAKNSIDFEIPQLFDNSKSQIIRNSMQNFSLSVNQLNLDNYFKKSEDKFSEAVNLYDQTKSMSNILSSDFDVNEKYQNTDRAQLKFSIFYDNMSNSVKLHIISINNIYNLSKLDDTLPQKRKVSKVEDSSGVEASYLEPAKYLNSILRISPSQTQLNTDQVVFNRYGLNEIQLKIQFINYDSRKCDASDAEDVLKSQQYQKNHQGVRRKILRNRKTVVNRNLYKSKTIKLSTNSSKSTDILYIDHVFTYSNMIEDAEKYNLNSISITDDLVESENLKHKFLVAKIYVFNNETKRKIGKVEIIINYLSLFTNPLNVFVQEFTPIAKKEKIKDDISENETSENDIVEKIKQQCDIQVLVSMIYVSQDQTIQIKLSKLKLNELLSNKSLAKYYIFLQASMFVLEKQVKKLRTKMYRINSIYDDTSLSYLNNSFKNDEGFETSDAASSLEFDLNESLIFNCSSNKFAQLYFKIELFIKKRKRKYQNELYIGKIVIGSINYCRTVNGFTQMDQTLRDAGNEVTFWHKVA